MIRIETDIKNIKMGEYYVKINGVYAVGDGGDLEVLERLYFAKDYRRVVFEEKTGNKDSSRYHYFSFDAKMYKLYDSIQGLLEQFGDVYVFNLYDIKPNKKSVKKVVGLLDKKNIAVFSILVAAIAGVLIFKNKGKNDSNTTNLHQQSIQRPPEHPSSPPVVPCHTNLPSFAHLFDYSDQITNGKLIKSINDKTIEVPIETTEVKPPERISIKIPKTMSENEFNMQDAGDKMSFTISGYDNCLMFIDLNKHLPFIIDSLTPENCVLHLEKSCIKG